jgi:hypothetical protein
VNANSHRAADDRRGLNVAAANELAAKLRTTEEPLTAPERLALASLLHIISDLVASRPGDSFGRSQAWATTASAFDVRMTLLRGDHIDSGGVL